MFSQELVYKHALKILSFVFALFIWFYVLSSRPIEQTIKVPLKFVIPQDKAIGNIIDKEVSVTLKGPRVYFRGVTKEKMSILLDLTKKSYIGKKNLKVKISESLLSLPFGVEVTMISPKEVNLNLKKNIYKKVPVKIKFINEPEEEYKLIKYSFSPKEFMIEGPINVMRNLHHLETVPVDLSQIKSSSTLTIPIEDIDPRLAFKTEDSIKLSEEISFSPVLKPKKSNYTIKSVPIRFLTTHKNFSTNIKNVDLQVMLSDNAKSLKNVNSYRVIADISHEKKGLIKVPLKVELPEGAHLLKVVPESLNLRVY